MTAALATPTFAFRRIPAALGFACALALPGFAAPALSSWCADALGDRVALAALQALAPVLAKPAAELEEPLSLADFTSEAAPAPNAAGAKFAAVPVRTARGKRGAKPAPAHAIFVSAAQVLALAQRRAMPGAVPVHASAEHPAGLKLRGVSALGVGMQDGDVLTEAAGQRVFSVATVVGAVLAERAARRAQISGRFYRAGVPYTVTVEQPYPPGS